MYLGNGTHSPKRNDMSGVIKYFYSQVYTALTNVHVQMLSTTYEFSLPYHFCLSFKYLVSHGQVSHGQQRTIFLFS